MSGHTKGKVQIRRSAFNRITVETVERGTADPSVAAVLICSFPNSLTQSGTDEIAANAALVAEAFNIAESTGATPWSLALRIVELELTLANVLQVADNLKGQQAMPDDSWDPILASAAATLARKVKA